MADTWEVDTELNPRSELTQQVHQGLGAIGGNAARVEWLLVGPACQQDGNDQHQRRSPSPEINTRPAFAHKRPPARTACSRDSNRSRSGRVARSGPYQTASKRSVASDHGAAISALAAT